jgi:hypothetical protein
MRPSAVGQRLVMPTINDVQTWRGRDALGAGGDKVGTIEDIYLDRESGEPEWVAIKTGLFGGKVSFAPLAEAQADGDAIQLPYDKAQIKDAPRVEADGELSTAEEAELYRHYGRSYEAGDTGDRHDTSGPTTDSAMTRSEEELRVGTAERETGRARLRKHAVVENVETSVPVRLEKETVAEEQQISEQVRKEQIDADGAR